MTTWQKAIKYLALALALGLIVSIFSSILRLVGLFGGFMGREGVGEEMTSYAISSEPRELLIDLPAAHVQIVRGDALMVESNLKYLKLKEKGGALSLTEKSGWGLRYDDPQLILYLPESYAFREVEITTGAGKLSVERLAADTLVMSLGAGDALLRDLHIADEAQIDGGAGRITVDGGTLRDLHLNMGVGELTLTATLLGACEFDMGVGKSTLHLLGGAEAYCLDIEKGIGSVTVDGQGVENGATVGHGEHTVDIDGGVGSILVTLSKQ